jgi:hypothetical protein
MADTAPKDLIGFLDFYLVQKARFRFRTPAGNGSSEMRTVDHRGPAGAVPAVRAGRAGDRHDLAPFAGPAYATSFGFVAILAIVNFVLMIAALPGLFARRRSGWNLIFYSELLHIVTSLLSGAIIGGLFGGLIGLYILFQIRTLYHP